MSKFSKTCLLISVLTLIGANSLANAAEQGKKGTLLFTQIAKSVDVTDCADKKQCDFHIVLKDIKNDETTYFSNRPQHFMDDITVADFVKNWSKGKDSFKVNHPNASFVYFDAQDNIVQNIVELMHPNFDAKQGTLSYDVKEIGKTARLKARTYEHPVLFIDTICLWTC